MNAILYAQKAELNWRYNLAAMSGYEPKYTFYSDLAIAEFTQTYNKDGNAVKSTIENLKKHWCNTIEGATELYLVLNHKIWAFYGDGKKSVDGSFLGVDYDKATEIAQFYNKEWEDMYQFVADKFGKDNKAMAYFYDVTD